MVNVIRNLWHDPHVTRNMGSWNGVIQTHTEEGYMQVSKPEDGRTNTTINPFGIKANLSDIVIGDLYILIVDCLPNTWKFTASRNGEIILDGTEDGLWIIKEKAVDNKSLSQFWYSPVANPNKDNDNPMTIKGLAVYDTVTWPIVKRLYDDKVIPSLVIADDTMPISIDQGA